MLPSSTTAATHTARAPMKRLCAPNTTNAQRPAETRKTKNYGRPSHARGSTQTRGTSVHLMYAYITQGRPDTGVLHLTPRAKAIITNGTGVNAAPILQPTQITTNEAKRQADRQATAHTLAFFVGIIHLHAGADNISL